MQTAALATGPIVLLDNDFVVCRFGCRRRIIANRLTDADSALIDGGLRPHRIARRHVGSRRSDRWNGLGRHGGRRTIGAKVRRPLPAFADRHRLRFGSHDARISLAACDAVKQFSDAGQRFSVSGDLSGQRMFRCQPRRCRRHFGRSCSRRQRLFAGDRNHRIAALDHRPANTKRIKRALFRGNWKGHCESPARCNDGQSQRTNDTKSAHAVDQKLSRRLVLL